MGDQGGPGKAAAGRTTGAVVPTLLDALDREARILATRAKRSKWPKAKSRLAERSIQLSDGAERLRAEFEKAEEKAALPWSKGRTSALLERVNGGPK